MQSELDKREALAPLLSKLENLQIRKGKIKVHPLDFVSRAGLWIKYQGNEKFRPRPDIAEIFRNPNDMH